LRAPTKNVPIFAGFVSRQAASRWVGWRAKRQPLRPAACSFRAEPSKILFSFLEEFFGGARKSEIVKSILLGGER
jgi:hypothetical protein